MIEKALPWLLFNFNPDGGASFRCDGPFRYGHDLMYIDSNVSSIFATWFRIRFPDCPGLQYPIDPHTGKATPG